MNGVENNNSQELTPINAENKDNSELFKDDIFLFLEKGGKLAEYSDKAENAIGEKREVLENSINEREYLEKDLNLEIINGVQIKKGMEKYISKDGKLINTTGKKLEDIIVMGQKFSLVDIFGQRTNIVNGLNLTGKYSYVIEGTNIELNIIEGYQILSYDESLKKNELKEQKEVKYSMEEVKNFAAMIISEARGEGIPGMIAVGNVILNRMKLWGKSMNAILFEKFQFSPIMDGSFKKNRRNLPLNILTLAQKILSGELPNPIGNATFFQTKTAEKSKGNWQKKANTLDHRNKIVIGNHIFRTEKKFR